MIVKGQIIATAEYITIRQSDPTVAFWQVRWDQIKEIVAWKQDVFIYDVICLGFRTASEPEYHWCCEDHDGWRELRAAKEHVLGIRASDWWARVAFPAFEKNWITVWGTPWPVPCANCGYDLRASRNRCPECGTPIPPPQKLY